MPVEAAILTTRELYPAANPSPFRDSRATAWWLWPHLLNLDAPLVAVLWQWWWAQSSHIGLSWCHSCVLGLGVWLIYLVDRLVDACRTVPDDPVRPRHAFHARWRIQLSACAAALTATLVLSAPCVLSRAEFVDGLVLLSLAIVYFWLIHGRQPPAWTAHLPKEAAVGGLFAVGTAFFPWCHNAMRPIGLPVAVGLFGGLCFCNCALITVWERQAQDIRDPFSLLNAFPGLNARLRWVCLALACLAGAGWLVTGSAVFAPLALSGMLLAGLDQRRHKLSSNALRVLADAVLLTPLLTGGFLRP